MTNKTSKTRKSKYVTVNDRMQRGYRYELSEPVGRNFDPSFRPELTPSQMLYLGVFCGTFATGYLIAWAGFSVLATGLQWASETARLMSPMLQTVNVWLGAAILLGAGLWQLTPLKTTCLRHCRSPLGFLIGSWRTGRLGAFRIGLEHGGVLSRVLLVPNGAAVLRRRDEPVLDRRSCSFRTAGEDDPAWTLVGPAGGRRFDRVGRVFAHVFTLKSKQQTNRVSRDPHLSALMISLRSTMALSPGTRTPRESCHRPAILISALNW